MHSVLLVGLGRVGMGYDFESGNPDAVLTHAKAFATHPEFQLVCGVDVDPSARAKFSEHYGAAADGDVVHALREFNPDVVVVAVPTGDQAGVVRQILDCARPKMLLCEKPLSYSIESANEIVSGCRDAGCMLYVNYLRRVEPGVLEVKRRLQSGSIAGRLKGILWYSKGLLHNGSHFSNLLEFWLGPAEGFGIIDVGRPVGDADMEPDIRVRYPAGDVTFLAAREENFTHHEIHLIAENGRLRYERGGTQINWQAAALNTGLSGYKILSQPGETIQTDGLRLQFRVAEAVAARLRGENSSLCSGEDALNTLDFLIKTRESVRKAKPPPMAWQ